MRARPVRRVVADHHDPLHRRRQRLPRLHVAGDARRVLRVPAGRRSAPARWRTRTRSAPRDARPATSRRPGSTARSPDDTGSPESGVAVDSGQCGRAISSTRQCLRLATTASAARQCAAWLSPIIATVSRACSAGSAVGALRRAPRSAGRACTRGSGVIAASSGVGRTTSRSRGFSHRRCASRAAAPKHFGAAAARRRPRSAPQQRAANVRRAAIRCSAGRCR